MEQKYVGRYVRLQRVGTESIANLERFGYVGFHGFSLVFQRTNQRRVACKECNKPVLAGEGVFKTDGPFSGYLHVSCAKKIIHIYGGRGFAINALNNLQLCHLGPAQFTAEQICDGIWE